MTKKICLPLLPAAFLVLCLACSCDSDKQYRAMGNTPAEKIENISSAAEAMNWDGPKSLLKEKLTDQISRVRYGMKKGVITDSEAEEIIKSIEALISKISNMEEKMSNRPGGMGGPPGGGMEDPPEGIGELPDGGGKSKGGDLIGLVRLKSLITDLYINTVSVSAETPAKADSPETK